MITARELARQAARGRVHSDASNHTENRAADAASGVWEPLMRDAIGTLEANVVLRGGPVTQLVKRLKEALDGSD